MITLSSKELAEAPGDQEFGARELEKVLGSTFNRLERQTYDGADELIHLSRRDDFVGSVLTFIDSVDG
eukprot:scaffold1147_cov250-Pinguiococcus_pyrenoidosus.AAC.7